MLVDIKDITDFTILHGYFNKKQALLSSSRCVPGKGLAHKANDRRNRGSIKNNAYWIVYKKRPT